MIFDVSSAFLQLRGLRGICLLQDGMQIEQHAANWLKSLKTRPPQGLQRFAQRFLEESDKICQLKVDVRLVIPPQLYLSVFKSWSS